MSQSTTPPADDDRDPWERLAEYEDTLEMLIEEGVPMAQDAEVLLEELEDRGLR
ncbi:hypothetical protein [Natrarchaeobaculum sulfurireducens]|uniref:Uncharacterized protein n=1 Tax=Natrarchaeobaculum sulfurireducens TaxID=2044521 RepID=A0A346PHG9_9EURY|nr:hypothetical protein [Natrarchaeobaculum sulfurireducens]AXR78964.1 hypothetical protein AArc1_2651 [Natrarchaeobaculum sulfurireducens]AXR80990.1 hypothetical protein AArcMg_0972 [Natrarchaeobaculum sulfurireducens]